MEITVPKLKYQIVDSNVVRYPVIVVAAGSSTRMQGVNKQLAMLSGEPVLIRTLRAFDYCERISRIILVVRDEDRLMIQRLCDEYGIQKMTDLVVGGSCRHDSVKSGLERLVIGENKVLIHDGARPLVSEKVIANVTEALKDQKAVICAVPIVDTVKRANEDGFVSQTVDRKGLYAVQTPQGVDVETYKAAMPQVTDADLLTDDASLMERFGVAVKVVDGSPYNIKITTQKDLRLAELYLKGEL